MAAPAQQGMEKAAEQLNEWHSAVLNTGGYMMFANGTDYQYKVPYNIQIIGFLSKRISRYCLLADETCCKCLNSGGGIPPSFMDMVDQSSGHQVRYQRTNPKMCGLIRPKMEVFKDGKFIGYMVKSRRVFNRCRTCMEDLRQKDVAVLEFFDEAGKQVAHTTRKGRGCCLVCAGTFPFRVGPLKIAGMGIRILTCAAVTCQAYVDKDPCYGLPFPFRCFNGKGDWCLMPHGCLSCDPVCCKGCVKGPTARLMVVDFPVICCPAPLTCCCISYPMMKFEHTRVPVHSTFRYENFVFAVSGNEPGRIQLQFRGNYRSAYEHDEGLPFTSAMEVPSSKGGLLATAIMMARSYTFGLPEPLLADVEATEVGPDFDGLVKCYSPDEIRNLQNCLDENLNVVQDCIVGDFQVKGYTLMKVGYNTVAGSKLWICQWGQGVVRKPVEVLTKQKLLEVVANGLGAGSREWHLRFMLKDPEKSILTRQTASVDKRFTDWYQAGGAKVRSLTCSIVRVCAFPCKTDRLETTLCRMPLYVDYPNAQETAQDELFVTRAPSQVVMHVGGRTSLGKHSFEAETFAAVPQNAVPPRSSPMEENCVGVESTLASPHIGCDQVETTGCSCV